MIERLATAPSPALVTAYYPPDDDGIARQLLQTHEARRQWLNGPIRQSTMNETVFSAAGMLWQKYQETTDPECAIFLRMNCIVFGRFIQATIDKRWETPDLPRQADRRLKAQIESEAQLWKAVFKCLMALNAASLWKFAYPHCDLGQALLGLILDQQLVGWGVIGWGDAGTVKGFLSRHQGINADLKAGRNKLEPGTISHDFVMACLDGADSPLISEAWGDFLKARSACLQNWRAQGQRMYKPGAKPGAFVAATPRKTRKVLISDSGSLA
jgi:hypothetical protein